MRCLKADQETINKQIDGIIEEEKRTKRIKLLLLGTGDSGKTTFLKQLKILYQTGYSEKQRLTWKPFVYRNIVLNINSLIDASVTLKNIPPLALENQEIISKFNSQITFQEASKYIKQLWKDPGIQHCFKRSSEFQLQDNCEYFFESIDRISAPYYIPSQDDVLQVRNRTTGITEVEINIGENKWTVVDVGGQRSERRKWIHCFDDITGIIFFASLSEYDQKLDEDKMTNRMSESLKLFKDIVNYKAFVTKNTPIILFLNKTDLFQKKIKEVPLNVCFKNYTGSNEYKKACAFIRKEFIKLTPNNEIQVFKTCATDTNNIKIMFKEVQDHIFNANFITGGSHTAISKPRSNTSVSANDDLFEDDKPLKKKKPLKDVETPADQQVIDVE